VLSLSKEGFTYFAFARVKKTRVALEPSAPAFRPRAYVAGERCFRARVRSQRDDAPITVWCGSHRFGSDDSFFRSVITVARKYADKEPNERPSEVRFYEALEGLRDVAPADGHVLLDQVEHRWRHPHCPPSLYVLALTLCAPDGGGLVA
jgi:hypothetical protein